MCDNRPAAFSDSASLYKILPTNGNFVWVVFEQHRSAKSHCLCNACHVIVLDDVRYTMGSAFPGGRESTGVIPSVMETLYRTIAADPATAFTVRVGFVEIHQVGTRPP